MYTAIKGIFENGRVTLQTIAFSFFLMMILSGCQPQNAINHTEEQQQVQQTIAAVLDSFHIAAGQANYQKYFGFFDEKSVFIGTDATEYWDKPAFMTWAKPFFDRQKTWGFKALQRHIYIDATGSTAWFDELLDTQMKICRGSGVLQKNAQNQWKIKQYVLSATIPNPLMDSVIILKSPIENDLIKALTNPTTK